MTKVTIKAPSGETNAKNLSTLDGVECQDDFVQYFDEDFSHKLKHGYMSFHVEDGKLFTVTEYEMNEPLVADELEILANYTQGQWSDGIGESFEQFPCAEENGEEIFVSPWYHGQKTTVISE
jgi:hypothetical protein